MDKVYIVTDGEYSDYRVVGVFDEKQKAQAMVDLYDCNELIEEFALNKLYAPEENGLYLFKVWFKDDGEVTKVKAEMDTMTAIDTLYLLRSKDQEAYYYNYSAGYTTMWARDKEHAIKTYSERRAFLIAENKYIPGKQRDNYEYFDF